jgi:Eukaryotic protein of unknown function (DUF829)
MSTTKWENASKFRVRVCTFRVIKPHIRSGQSDLTINATHVVDTMFSLPKPTVRTSIREKPRAVAIVLGHLGCTAESLAEYGRLYEERNCTVITAVSPVLRFVLNWNLRATACEILDQAAAVLQDTSSDVPLLIHSFSNGGAFLLEEMEQQLQQGRLQKTNSAYKYEFLASRMKNGCQLFDSCPCYIRPIWDTKYYSSSFPHPQWYKCSRLVYTAVASLSLTLWCTCTLSWHRPDQFWKRMLQSNVCLHQIFIYTTTDLLSDAASMDRFINNRRAQNVECTVYRYDDSDHCRLNRDHPEAYGRAIDTALSDSIRRSTGK